MNKKFLILSSLIFFLSISISIGVRSEEASPKPVKACASPFSVTIAGTRNYSDISFIKNAFDNLSYVCRVVPSLEANKLTILVGDYNGKAETMIEDIKGIIVDRFQLRDFEKEPELKLNLVKLGM